jgi:hypothetical protein
LFCKPSTKPDFTLHSSESSDCSTSSSNKKAAQQLVSENKRQNEVAEIRPEGIQKDNKMRYATFQGIFILFSVFFLLFFILS